MTAPVIDRAEWFIVAHPQGDYLRAYVIDEQGEEIGRVYADLYDADAGIEVNPHGPLTAFGARELAARVAEAAAFVDGGPA